MRDQEFRSYDPDGTGLRARHLQWSLRISSLLLEDKPMNSSNCHRRVRSRTVVVAFVVGCALPLIAIGQDEPRARDLGIPFTGTPGPLNAITDVAGVTVGHTTLISGDGRLIVGSGPIRTGVTAILPRGKDYDPVFAGWYALNGNGEMTGTTWVEESGFLEGPIVITNTHSVGVARDAIIEWQFANKLYDPLPDEPDVFWSLPVVAETYDGDLNDINGFHVKKEHVISALDSAKPGPVSEGNVGGGTGMICHQFKGGIGTASRKLRIADRNYTLGVLVQANYGSRETLTIAGVPLGEELADLMPEFRPTDRSTGSIIVAVATDAPLLPHQLKRLARRVPIGISKVGGYASNGSGDIFIAFSTANPGTATRVGLMTASMLPNDAMSPLFLATAQATEEAIVNALVAAKTMVGINGNTVYALPQDRLLRILKDRKRIR
jgi:D-aminopeptidase